MHGIEMQVMSVLLWFWLWGALWGLFICFCVTSFCFQLYQILHLSLFYPILRNGWVGLGGRLRLGSKVGPKGPTHLAPQGGWGQRSGVFPGLPRGRDFWRWWVGQVGQPIVPSGMHAGMLC